ncbi:secy-independent transporter protein [Stylonychia lemnae]|uniref:Secy-independent transporter protein n=1 Tax=Stylonychia lemnae TaxID=5949 RepID=A0A078AXV9_STYLE|nr:secy-independent transporter protein [Stylonychia lemnae]|eukprot:CDW87014.1 secy-independent transporter protein [Stylonychia lemnae]
MEEKFKAFRKFDWTLSEKWQLYLSNLYPIPARDRLEKIRKRWYRDNIDKEFDINYEEPSDEQRQQQQSQQRAQGSQNQYQQNPYAGYQYPEQLPSFKLYQEVLWVVFLLSIPFRFYTGFLAFGALLCGLIRRHGYPKFSQEYLQRVAFDDNFHMITYVGTLTMSSGSLIMYVPLILSAFLEISPSGKKFIEQYQRIPFVSYFKDTFDKGVTLKSQFIEMRSDFEVYIGLYLIVVWFIGWSNFLQIIIYWQLMRVRYMMSANLQAAFRRLDTKISGYLQSPSVPEVVRTVYIKMKSFLAGMAEQPNPNQAPSGGVGGLLSRCSIF